jgi:hypothetical protein
MEKVHYLNWVSTITEIILRLENGDMVNIVTQRALSGFLSLFPMEHEFFVITIQGLMTVFQKTEDLVVKQTIVSEFCQIWPMSDGKLLMLSLCKGVLEFQIAEPFARMIMETEFSLAEEDKRDEVEAFKIIAESHLGLAERARAALNPCHENVCCAGKVK